jgi:hypothetical protein
MVAPVGAGNLRKGKYCDAAVLMIVGFAAVAAAEERRERLTSARGP